MTEIDVVVVGAGVAGLACAARARVQRQSTSACSNAIREPGMDTSTHNSGVVHAGIYYPPGSLKARLCVEGRELALRLLRAPHGVPHDACGKLIVGARPTRKSARSRRCTTRGSANGVEDLDMVDARVRAQARAARRRRRRALVAVDGHRSRRSARPSAAAPSVRDRDVALLLVGIAGRGGRSDGDRLEVRTGRERIRTRLVVNAAGLYADEVSASLGGEAFTIYPCRGEYAELAPSRRSLVNGLVYPVPHQPGHGLGVHLTRTVDGAVLLGPTIRYQAQQGRLRGGSAAARRLPGADTRSCLPDVTLEDLRLGGSGIRAEAAPAERIVRGFHDSADSRCRALIHAAGIDSPGLTSCLAIAKMVAGIAAERLD